MMICLNLYDIEIYARSDDILITNKLILKARQYDTQECKYKIVEMNGIRDII